MGNCQFTELSSQSLTLNPVLVTSRSCLPLAYLDLSGNTHGIPGTQLFRARLHILENTAEGDSCDQRILIAENCAVKASLYAIERVDAGLYTLCPLNGCATVKTLMQLQAEAAGILSTKQRCCLRINPQDSGWWRDLAIKDRIKIQVDAYEMGVKFPRNVRLCLQNQSPAETLSVANNRAFIARRLPGLANADTGGHLRYAEHPVSGGSLLFQGQASAVLSTRISADGCRALWLILQRDLCLALERLCKTKLPRRLD